MNIIELAKEAGFDVDEGLFPFEATEDKYIGTERVLERFAALVAAHERDKAKGVFEELEREVKEELINAINCAVEIEREACAKVCDEAMIQMNYSEAPYKQCAAAIRARGEK